MNLTYGGDHTRNLEVILIFVRHVHVEVHENDIFEVPLEQTVNMNGNRHHADPLTNILMYMSLVTFTFPSPCIAVKMVKSRERWPAGLGTSS